MLFNLESQVDFHRSHSLRGYLVVVNANLARFGRLYLYVY